MSLKIAVFSLYIPYVLAIYTKTNWQSTVNVNEYVTYSSGQLLEYKVPENALMSHWLLTGYRAPSKCDTRTLVISLQHGSFPLINPLNESFPPNFHLTRTNIYEIDLQTDNATLFFQVPNPLAGSWYAMAYLNDYIDDKITQKGIGTTCSYFLAVTHMTEALDFVPQLSIETRHSFVNISGGSNSYRFVSPDRAWHYRIAIENCTYIDNSFNTSLAINVTSPCPLSLAVRGDALPLKGAPGTSEVTCDATSCFLDVYSPTVSSWQHLLAMTPSLDILVSFNLSIEVNECTRVWESEDDNIVTYTSANTTNMTTQENPALSSSNTTLEDLAMYHTDGRCYIAPELGRMSTANRPFQVKYTMHLGIATIVNRVYVVDDKATVIRFEVEPLKDTGGTLRFSASLEKSLLGNSSMVMEVSMCIKRSGIPLTAQGLWCDDGSLLTVNSSDSLNALMYFPYPEPGSWFVAFEAKCYANRTYNNRDFTLVPTSCEEGKIIINFEVTLSPCVNGGCGNYGNCREYFSGILHFSSCSCLANYRGYACNDASVADSDAAQLTATLLLTFSNFMFIPAIAVAIYRHFYVEALVYFYTMFFSTFYHACDGNRHYLYCLMPYNVLGHCDFFGAIMSFWVTLVAMARMPERLRAVAFMLAALGLAMGVTWDRHSLWTFLVPCALALGGMLLSWSYRCRQRRECYPSKKRWLLFITPGVLIAIVGLIIFAFFETESNYQFTHSAWHACMALCIVFILPPRRQSEKIEVTPENLNSSSITLVRCDSSAWRDKERSEQDAEANGKHLRPL